MAQSLSVDKSGARDGAKPRHRKPMFDSGWGRTTLQLAAVIAFFAIWEGAARAGWVSNFLVGSPVKIYEALVRSAQSGELFVDTRYQLRQRPRSVEHLLCEELFQRVGVVRELSRQALEERHRERVDVRADVDGLSACLLG